ncbi:hypothetical protein B0H12DRAFT_1239779 [Mycena haematopus]|nr:hypothetical protein B0H12DRAFT_1239779 [Mycena haematopus]
MPSEIPADIWRCVAVFLPKAFLLTLFSVNRTFLAIARETRYQAITFTTYKGAKPLIKHVKWVHPMKWLLELLDNLRTYRDSKLVHSIRVQPWIVQPKGPKSHSWASSTWKLLHACVSTSYGFEEPEAEIARRLQKQTRRVADLIKDLPELRKYHIDWDEGRYHNEFFSTLLELVIPTIGRRLCTLTLKVPLSHMPLLPSLAVHLPNLESFSLTIHTGSHVSMYISQTMEGLVVFLNNLLRNLHTLSLFTTPTSTHLDLVPLFRGLGRGRHLTSFTLCIPFDGGHLADPAPLREFLSKNRATLESLNLGTTRAAAHPNPGAATAKFWIRDTFKNHPSYPALSHLSLSLRPLRADLGPLLRCLSGVRSQLRILKLSERPLEHADLVRILGALDYPPQLRVLSLRLRWLSPEIVDLLAAGLPELTALDLNFHEVIHQDPSSDACSLRSEDSASLSRESELLLFCQRMNGKKYLNWNLTHLAVPESPSWQLRWLDSLERLFVGCIPALSFSELVSA